MCFRIKVYPAPGGPALVTNSHAGAERSSDVRTDSHQHDVHHKETRYGKTSAGDMT